MNTKCLWLSGYYNSSHKGVIYVPGWLCEVVSDHSLGIIKATVTPPKCIYLSPLCQIALLLTDKFLRRSCFLRHREAVSHWCCHIMGWLTGYPTQGPQDPCLLIGHNERHTVTFKTHVDMCIHVACVKQRFGWMLLNFCMSLLQPCILNSWGNYGWFW